MDESEREAPAAEFVWPQVVEIGMDAPVRWLRLGWADFCAAIEASLAYGAAFTVMGWLLLGVTKEPAYELALVTGFLIVGPFLCLGLYDISRRLELKERVRLPTTLDAWRHNAPAVGFYALILALLMAVWLRISSVVVALFFPRGMPSLQDIVTNVVTAPEGIVFVGAYVLAGAGFALLVFATSAVSIPMLLDRERMDALTAMIVSFNALRKNFAPMMLWAAIIVVVIGAGFLSWFAGLAVAVPVIGHGAWHAYRDLVR
jgi:uncharacterized membrane protein